MSRACSVCTSPNALKIDKSLFSNEPVASVASSNGLSESAVRRHARNHVHATILREIHATNSTSSTDILERLVEALDDVSAVRSAALLSGQSGVLLRAAGATQSIATSLLGYLGQDGDLGILRQLKVGEAFARAVAGAIRADPTIAPEIAEQLRLSHDPDVIATADVVDRLANIATKKEI